MQMRRTIYGAIGLSAGLIFSTFLFVDKPHSENVKVAKVDHGSLSERQDLRSINGTISTIFENGTYVLNERDLDNYSASKVIKYGKVNPMFKYAHQTGYNSCDEMKVDHPSGVPESDPAYSKKLDADNDGRACESEDNTAINGQGDETQPSTSSGGNVVEKNYDILKNGANKATGFNVTTNQLEEVDVTKALLDFNQTAILPVDQEHYQISSQFGERDNPFAKPGEVAKKEFHSGIDFSTTSIFGKNIYSVSPGEIVAVEDDKVGYGKYVIVQHNGYRTLYGHLSEYGKYAVGDKVQEGSVIGKVGSTGRSTGPHLHFEVRIGTVTVDPALFLSVLK